MKKRMLFICITMFIIIAIIGFVVISKARINNEKNKDNNIENNIELNTSIWVTPLTKYTIDSTDDTFEITHDISFPKSESGVTSSWTHTINYIITCDGIEYPGSITFDSNSSKISYNEDVNPHYNIKSTDFKANSVLVNIKKIKKFF